MAVDHVPYVPASRILPEITPKGVALAVILAMVLTAANVYLGLYVGMTVSASIPAAVLSMGMLRAIAAVLPRQETNILENNWVQTAVSAGESLAAGVIFTLPALVVLGTWDDFSFFPVFITAAVGGTIGVLFSISLRRIFVIQERLPYPEGVACAEVLVAGEKGGTQVLPIIAGMGFGAIYKLGAALEIVVDGVLRKVSLGLWRNSWHDHFTFQGRLPEFGTVTQSRTTFFFGIELSPALLGVGYIVGPMIGSFVFLGGFLGALVVLPLTSGLLLPPEGMSIGDFVGFIEMRRRMVGVGTMLVGGLYTLVLMRGPVIKGIRDMLEKVNVSEDRSGLSRTDLDLDPQIVSRLSLAMALPMALMVWWVSGLLLPAVLALLIVFSAGYIFAAIAGYMAGLLGSSNNPISGVTIIVVIFTASLFTLLNWLVYDGAHTQDLVVATIGVAAFVCCAGAISGDNLQDLKTGNIVGATPWRQQVAQLVGVLAGALVIPLVLNLLISTYELGKDLAAPQAFLMAALASGILEGTMDWAMVLLGAGIAFCLVALRHHREEWQGLPLHLLFLIVAYGLFLTGGVIEDALAEFVFMGSLFVGATLAWMFEKGGLQISVMAVAVGMYLPIIMSIPIFLGGMIRLVVDRRLGLGDASEAERDKAHGPGVLFASGLIAGEAIMGVLLAFFAVSGVYLGLLNNPLFFPGLMLFAFAGFSAGWFTLRGAEEDVMEAELVD